MSDWDYTREESNRLSPGDYRVQVVSAETAVSKSGNNMVVLGIRPNGSNITINHYMVRNEYWNRNLTRFYDSFNVPEGNLNFMEWINAVGAARLKEDENGYLKVAWFIDKKRAEKLPPWQGDMPERQTVTDLDNDLEEIEDEDLPF
jgi:hypothetical protein